MLASDDTPSSSMATTETLAEPYLPAPGVPAILPVMKVTSLVAGASGSPAPFPPEPFEPPGWVELSTTSKLSSSSVEAMVIVIVPLPERP